MIFLTFFLSANLLFSQLVNSEHAAAPQPEPCEGATSSASGDCEQSLLLTRETPAGLPTQPSFTASPAAERGANASPPDAGEAAADANTRETVPWGASSLAPLSSATSELVGDEEVDGFCSETHCKARPRREGREKISFNKYKGVSILFLCALFLLLHMQLNQHPRVTILQSAYEDAPPHYSSLSAAAHVLQRQKGSSILLLLAALPFWQGLLLSGLLRVFFSVIQMPQTPRDTRAAYPGVSGLAEVSVALFLLLMQEVQEDTLLQLLRSEPSKSIIPGLLLAGSLLIISSACKIARWRKEWTKQKSSQKPTMHLRKMLVSQGPEHS